MSSNYIEITYDDVISAIGKNGYVQIYGSLTSSAYDPDTGKIVFAGCAMGQAAINLNIDPHTLERFCGDDYLLPVEKLSPKTCDHFTGYKTLTLTAVVEHLNDSHHLALNAIEKTIRKIIRKEDLKKTITIPESSRISSEKFIKLVTGEKI